MDSVLLFSFQTEQIKITIEAYFDDGENLVIDGYDIGKTVEEAWGDYSEIQDYLTQHNIRFEGFSWM